MSLPLSRRTFEPLFSQSVPMQWLAAVASALIVCAAHSSALAAPVAPVISPPQLGDDSIVGLLPGGNLGDAVFVYVNGTLAGPPALVGLDGSFALQVPTLAAGDLVWAQAIDASSAPGPQSGIITLLEPLPAPSVDLPLLATANAVQGEFSCNNSAFAISQGGFGFQAYPLNLGNSVESLYGYGQGAPNSANSGLEKSGTATLVLHRNTVTGALALVVVLDAPLDGSGGTASLSVSGLSPSAELLVADDPAGPTASYNLAAGEFAWTWDACCTGGMAIGPLPDSSCLGLSFSGLSGITSVDMVHSSPAGPVRITLPSPTQPFVICGVPCSEAAVTVRADNQIIGVDETASPTWSIPASLSLGQQVTARASHPLYGAGTTAGPFAVQLRTTTPVLTTPVLDTATLVQGTLSGESDGTTVKVFRNGPDTLVGTGTVAAQAWSISVSVAAPLQPGDILYATAEASGKAESFPSEPVFVQSVDKTAVPQVQLPLVDGDLIICGKSTEPGPATIQVFVGPVNVGSTQASNGNWCLNLAAPLVAGQSVSARAQAPGKAISASSPSQAVLQRTKTPIIQTPAFAGVFLVKGTVADADGTEVRLFRDGALWGATTALDGKWSIVTNALVAGELLSARAQTAGKGESFESTGVLVVVNAVSAVPTLTVPIVEGDVEISGSCEPGTGVAVLFKNQAFLGTVLVTEGPWTYALTAPLQIGDIITAQCQITGKGTSPMSPAIAVVARTTSPQISSPIYDDDVSISGTLAEPNGSQVTVYHNGLLFESTSSSAGTFTVGAPSPLQAGDQIFATAKADGKAVSPPSAAVVVLFRPLSATPTLTTPLVQADTTVSGTSSEAQGTIITIFVNGEQVATAQVGPGGTYTASVPALAAGAVVTAVAKADGKKASAPSNAATVLAKSAPPAVNAPIFNLDTQVTGTVSEASGTVISVLRNGTALGQSTASGGIWALNLAQSLSVGDVICARAQAPGKALSDVGACATVQVQLTTATPSISSPVVEGAIAVSGSVGEGVGTQVTLTINGTTAGVATVTTPSQWAIQLATAVPCGAVLVATAKAPSKATSAPSAPVTALCLSAAPTIDAPVTDCDTTITGKTVEPDGATIRLFIQGQVVPLSQGPAAGGVWALTISAALPASTNLVATAQAAGKAQSPPSPSVIVVPRPASPAPTLTAPLLQLDQFVAGSSIAPDGSVVRIYVNGALAGSGTVQSGAFVVAIAKPLEYADKVTATVQADCEQESAPSSVISVDFKDSDGDTITDVDEMLESYPPGLVPDADGDEIDNLYDLDSDGDGIPDAVEAGDADLATPPIDTDGDGIPDFLDLDSDGDGKPDAEEGTGDSDGDGIPNWIDADDNDGPLGDADGDTISNKDEMLPTYPEGLVPDADGDGIDNMYDLDSDGDGIPDAVEAGDADLTTPPIDSDGDGIPDFLDLDSDGDGIPDAIEGVGDCDGDGIPNYLDLDSDGDGIPDSEEGYADSDNDGIPDFCDPEHWDPDADDDDDGIKNGDEGKDDADGDGIPNYLDLDSDGDGIPDWIEAGDDDLNTPPVDTDGDGIPDFLDLDSDGDTISDADEMKGDYPDGLVPDADGDGIMNFRDLDSDGDGIPDAEEAGDADLNTPPVDSDGDGIPDFLDLDSDGDTISDADETRKEYPAGLVPDADGDGIPNYLDLDSDGDGWSDAEEAGDADLNTPPVDTDGDGIPDFLDLDSDGDGIPDDIDNCRLVANPGQQDTDFDGIGDVCDNCPTFPNPLQEDTNGNGTGDACEDSVLDETDDNFLGALYGGGGCRTTGGPSALWLGLFALLPFGWFAARRRKNRRPFAGRGGGALGAIALAGLFLGAPAPSGAQDIDIQRFRPAAGKGNQVLTHGSEVGQHLDYSLGFMLDYARNPLILVFGNREESVVSDLLTGHFLFGLSLWDFMQLGLNVPVNLYLRGAYEDRDLKSATMGDISFDIKFRVLNPERAAGFGLALVPTITFPTGNSKDFSGSGSFGGLVRVAMDYRVWRMMFALNLGYGLRADRSIRNVNLGSELFFNAGASYNFIDPLTFTLELVGATSARDPFSNNAEGPMELLASLKAEVIDGLHLVAGGGAGLTVGVGSPDARAFLGVSWAPEVRDTDGDGIVDDLDKCPLEPEDFDGFQDEDGCPDPDNDGDGIPDKMDSCPNEPEDFDGFLDEDGCPDPDNDQDGILDAQDKCPNQPEDFDGYQDEDGCPDPDNDGDGIPDAIDKCPNDPETYNGFEDQDGCPDQALIELKDDYIQINDKVYFDFNKDTIQPRSFELLNQIAELLKGRKDIRMVLIGGHTDSKGKDLYNLNLSQRRADSVMRYLIERGVENSRLKAQGFGRHQPVATNDTDEGREKNRRVEFLILEQGPRQ